MICAIVLAAGRSRRMGTQKLLLPFAGATVIARVVDQFLAAALDGVYVVVGRDADRIAAALAGRDVHLVTNPDPNAEMLSSVRCGLRALPPRCDAVMVAPADQPAVTTELVNEMLRAFPRADKGILVPTHEGRRGHPLLLSTRYRDEILTHYDGVGLRGLMQAHADDVAELAASDAALSDMDLPEDYRRELRARQSGRGETS
jgi:molybdenum cofactor cytidylyltransferase